MSSNKSIAVWAEPVAGQADAKLEVHFNYWRVGSTTGLLRYFCPARLRIMDFAEIGLKISNISSLRGIFLYFPAEVSRDCVADCAPYFKEALVVQGIFNKPLDVVVPNEDAPLEFVQPTGKIFCRMHRFGSDPTDPTSINPLELSITPYSKGCLFTIKAQALNPYSANPTDDVYYRLRIRLPSKGANNPFVETIKVYDRFVLSSYDQIEYLDFRLNEVRTLPQDVEHKLAADQPLDSVKIKLVAFLTAIPVHSELSVAHTQFHKMRLLEHAVWSNYAPGVPRGMVVYHWKREEDSGIRDFSAFVKLQTRLSGSATLLKYLVFLIAFGTLGSLVAGEVQTHFHDILKLAWDSAKTQWPWAIVLIPPGIGYVSSRVPCAR